MYKEQCLKSEALTKISLIPTVVTIRDVFLEDYFLKGNDCMLLYEVKSGQENKLLRRCFMVDSDESEGGLHFYATVKVRYFMSVQLTCYDIIQR